MRRYLLKCYIVLLTQIVIIKGVQPNKNSSDESRHSRGRVLKSYSEFKHEPITCNNEGFLADPINCSIFYRCIKSSRGKYTVVKFQCSPGTVYDPEIETCNHPQNTKRSECMSSRPFQYITAPVEQINDNDIEPAVQEIPSPITTRKPIYDKQTGSISELPNKPTYLPSPIPIAIQSFEYGAYGPSYQVPSTIKAQTNEIIKTTETQATLSSTGSTTQYQWMPPSNQYGSITSITAARLGNECIHDGFMGDTEDCRKFYRCVNDQRGGFKKFEFMCSESTIWDDDIQSCNHPWAVRHRRCGRDTSSSEFVSKHEEYYSQKNNSLIEKDVSGYILNKSENPVKVNLPLSTSNQINYGDRINFNENIKNNVTDNMTNNQEIQTNYPIMQKETDYITQSYETITKTSSYVTDGVQHNTSYSTNPSTYKVINNTCTESGFMGDLQDCRKFYRCVENGRGSYIKHEFQCGEGTAWDKNIESCNYVWMVKECGDKDISNSFTSKRYDSENMYTTLSNIIRDDITSVNNGYSYQNQNQNQTKTSTSSTESTIITTVSFVQTSVQSSDNNFVNDVNYVSTNHQETTAKPFTTSQVLTNMENKCEKSGFMGDSYDCRKFYRCVDNGNGVFTRFEYLCGEGTVWDKNINACNHIWAVESCGSNHSEVLNESSHLPSFENDNNSYYNHTNEIYKDPIISTERNTVVNLSNMTATISHTTQSGYSTQRYNYTKVPVQNSIDLSTTNVPGSNKGVECKTVGFLADKSDCKRFYRCVENGLGGFDRFDFSCGEGTVWDSNIQACNHASLVKDCGTGNYNITTASLIEITTQSMSTVSVEVDKNIQEHSETESPTTIKASYVNNTCTSDGFYGDENDCQKFYRCIINQQGGFIKYEFSCGEGTVWDQNIQACGHAPIDSINCKISTANLLTTSPPSINPPGSTESYTTLYLEGSSTQKNSDYIPDMGNTCVAEGFYPNSKDCKKFFRCVSNGKGFIRYDFTCGEGTIWVQAIQACDHESDNSTCNIESVSDGYVSTTTHTTSSHIITAHSEAPNTNMESNETSSDWSTQSHECHSEGYYEKPNDCRQFYRCVLNDHGTYTKYDYICSEGTAWDIDKKSCNHIDTVKRCQSTNIQNIESTTVKRFEEETTTTETIMTTRSSTLTPESIPLKEDALNVTECESEGYFGNKKDCQKFYRCVDDGKSHFVRYDYVCGDGTIWDQDILTCNHPRDVTNQSCDNVPTNASSTEPSIQSTTSVSSSFQSSSTPSISTQIATSSMSTQTATSSMSTQTATTSTSTQTAMSSMSTQTETSSTSIQTATSSMSTQTATSSISTQTVTSSIPPQTAAPSTTTQTNEGSGQETPICSQEGTSKNPKNQNITCTKAGYFANPSDCKKFYRCVDWDGDGRRFSVFHFECGEGTIWDPALDTCNYEESVYPPRNCNATQAQNNNSLQTTTTDQTSISEPTTTLQTSSTETTSTQSTPADEQTIEQQSSTNQMSSSTTTPTDTSSTTMTSTDTISTTVAYTDMTSTTVTPIDATSTTYQTTSEQSTTDITTTQTDKSTTTTVETSTNENTSSISEQTTISEKTTTTTEATTSTTEQQTSSTLEQSSTEQPTTQTTVSAIEETTLQGSTTAQQTSTQSSTETSNTSTTETLPTSTGSTTQSTEASTTQGSSTVKDCPDTEDDQYLYACPTSFKRHPKYCNLFYQCIENNENHELKIATFNCPNGTIYDESKIQCVEESKAEKKCQGIIAKNRRIKRLNFYSKETISVSEDKYGCSGVGHYPFEKNEQCSPAILKCEISKRGKVQGFVYRCPDNYIYWSVSRRCEPISMMTECKNSSNQWIGRSEIPTERKNVA